MKAPVITTTRGTHACPVCETPGRVGASCDACLHRAYRNALAMAQAAELQGALPEVRFAGRELRSRLLAGLAGAEICREVLPGARFEVPDVQRVLSGRRS